MDEMEQYRELFMTEAEEHLQSLNQNLVDLENCPENTDIINLIFRSAHTLKGSARTLGFEHISQLTHHMEDILDNIRDGKIPVNHEIMDLLFKCLDALETMVGEIANGENETTVDYESIIDIIKNLKNKHLGGNVENIGNSASPVPESTPSSEVSANVNSANAVANTVSCETNGNSVSVSNKQSYSLKNEKTVVIVEIKKDIDCNCEENEVSELDINDEIDVNSKIDKSNNDTDKNINTDNSKLNVPENIDEILAQMHQSSNTLCAISGALELPELQTSTKKISRFTKSVLDKKIDMDKDVLQMINKSLSIMNSIAKSIENKEEVQKYGNDDDINNLDNFVSQKVELKNSNVDTKEIEIENDIENDIVNGAFEEIEIEFDHTIFDYLKNLNKLAKEIDNNSNIWHIKSEIEEDCMLKSVRFTMLLNSLENDSDGKIIQSIPTIDDLKNVSYDNLDILYAYSGSEEKLESILNSACEMKYSKAVKVGIEINTDEIGNMTELTDSLDCNLDNKEISCDYKIRFSIDPECALKSVRAYMVLKDLSEIGAIVDSCPSFDRIKAGDSIINQVEVYFNTRADIDTVEDTIVKTPEIKNIDVTSNKKDNQSAIQNSSEDSDSEDSKSSGKSERKEGQSKKSESKKSQTVRVNIEKLDKLMNLVGEVVINRANFTQIATKYDLKELHNAVGRLNMLSTELQEEVMSMRMIPVAFVFNRFPRTVRDTARALNKEIDFIIEGSEIELDRTVLDELAEPLTHLIRNSLDHGIEHSEVRKQAKKPEKGLLKLIATRERDRVNIVIKDDGKGIDPDGIRNNVVKKGLMSRDEVDKLTDNEAINLIFLPGFSTAEKVSDVSGRGVGMDVVRTKIESLGGSVSVHSEVGKGSEIVLHLPLTMAIIQTLLVKLKDQIYALPLTSVLDVVSVNKEEINNLEGQEAIIYRDHILPVTWLCDALHQYNDCSSEEIYVVVVEKNKGKIGLILDEVIGRDEIVVKPLTGILKNINGLAGATILGDGKVALILDLNNL
ncbi:two-component system chemotaxis sensor kinase CheA [Methanococcus voltae PS]|uniref:Chemotaxis protein CheA n=1 Tax=Methanococcus voltae PS TaxID=523842 RepID=A0ABT2EUW6_METVO|nr:chemotaxis protein CheW [Methanococcus voltae]MCS3921751.1 two-component system chemotaxis sensor kinase CheA [Methanococcus voltae PS]